MRQNARKPKNPTRKGIGVTSPERMGSRERCGYLPPPVQTQPTVKWQKKHQYISQLLPGLLWTLYPEQPLLHSTEKAKTPSLCLSPG